ncbi:MAG: HDOD domain-containing protein [Curvibacter sp.]
MRSHADTTMDLQRLLETPGALPSIPRVIALGLTELEQEAPDLMRVSALLSDEPVMTARLLQVANSARYQLSQRIGTVAQALAVLGLSEVREMLLLAAVASAFRRVGTVDMRQFWRYSLNTARLMRQLARSRASLLRQSSASPHTVGLVHALGELVMQRGLPARQRALLDQHYDIFAPDRATAEMRLLGYSYAQVGAGFARTWNLPQELIRVVEQHDDPFAQGNSHEPLAALLHMAAWRCRAREMAYDEDALAETYPEVAALALRLQLDEVLAHDPVEWASESEVEALAA